MGLEKRLLSAVHSAPLDRRGCECTTGQVCVCLNLLPGSPLSPPSPPLFLWENKFGRLKRREEKRRRRGGGGETKCSNSRTGLLSLEKKIPFRESHSSSDPLKETNFLPLSIRRREVFFRFPTHIFGTSVRRETKKR